MSKTLYLCRLWSLHPRDTGCYGSESIVKLSIVIPTYNAHEWIEQCLDSIRVHRPSCDYEIIVVDDTSSDDTVAIVKSKFPDVRLFANDRTLGFGKTVNAGL